MHGLHPDVVLLDLDLGDDIGDGSTLVPDLVRHGAVVVVVSASRDDVQVGRALMGGAAGFLSKDRPLDELVETVLAAARGEEVMDARRRADVVRDGRAVPALASACRRHRAADDRRRADERLVPGR